ncbi:endonuclease III [Halobacterium salinarum]|uniref:Endonuclease III n=5 Tax=Halobacterium salinarum TaxID=2242 RepID=Q9HRQ5_HALSA|nr:endonuclease III [Halobacterium salinarum]AAG19103.1 endonuclease III [Halobacterium salinarum NRC-1]MBB6089941.1 endonuclease-3 [Halobacterium salinarum]MDL0120659.1 endonuclease III [Halobacterium salinarum]MDL0123892.1 endonuclease III [Halobacterium salinarum]MDL0130536.1 endonuclease III [Halobacterium salinarum]
MGTRLETRSAQVGTVIDRLREQHPDPEISLRFSSRMELLVAVILSAQCTDERVNAETEHLFDTYETVADYANADEEALAAELNSITYYNSKAGYIKSAAQSILEDHDGAVPDTMSDLTDLSGVGRKTANVVLQHGHDLTQGIVVDTHVQRLSRRLGITEKKRPEAIETDLMPVVPEDHWKNYTHWLIAHGRETCTARNPDCGACVLADICPSSKTDHDIDLADGSEW